MIVIALLLVVVLVFAACKKEEAPVVDEPMVEETTEETTEMTDTEDAMMYTDGVYFARDEIGARWTYFVTVTVEGGKIVDAYWGGTNFVPNGDKEFYQKTTNTAW